MWPTKPWPVALRAGDAYEIIRIFAIISIQREIIKNVMRLIISSSKKYKIPLIRECVLVYFDKIQPSVLYTYYVMYILLQNTCINGYHMYRPP